MLLWGGVFGNLINFPVTIGVNIVFGSIFAVLALLLWQQWWGLIIGVSAALVTWSLWGIRGEQLSMYLKSLGYRLL